MRLEFDFPFSDSGLHYTSYLCIKFMPSVDCQLSQARASHHNYIDYLSDYFAGTIG